MRIAVLPAGQWGSALALAAADNGHEVWLYFRSPGERAAFVAQPGLQPTESLDEAIQAAQVIFLACPAQHMRSFVTEIADKIPAEAVVVSLAKGLEKETGLRMTEVIIEVAPEVKNRLVVISGPNFAVEVAKRLPSATVVAAQDSLLAKQIQDILHTNWLRPYTSPDVIGVELGGAIKNAMAIICGISDGLARGENARAALLARCLAEMSRFGVALGAEEATFYGLSGVGDLILTGTGGLSRNHYLGIEIARINRFDEKLGLGKTVEGLATIAPVLQLAHQYNVDMPLIRTLQAIIENVLTPIQAFEQIMGRPVGPEIKT